MSILIIALCLILIAIIVVQIGRVSDLASRIRGAEETQIEANNVNGIISMLFVVVFLIGSVVSAFVYKNYMLGYGPHVSASVHGVDLDRLFNVTLIFTGIVFVITQFALFYFAYKYRGRKGKIAKYLPHNNTVEIIWTVLPAIVMTYLVIGGLDVWNKVMDDVNDGDDYIEIEATGTQFNWLLRYPGPDATLGTRDYTKITGLNPLGQVWEDVKNLDDIHPNEIVLPKGKKVRVRIMARDVLHNFYLPHFRVKMDAIPGLPTYFIFTPSMTTEEYRLSLSKYPEYNVPADPEDPESPMKWEVFEYELACAELCGNGHYSMRRLVKIVEEEEYQAWLSDQKSWYMQSVRGSDEDPFSDQILDFEITERKASFIEAVDNARAAESDDDKVIVLEHVNFETGSSTLTADSQYELENVVEAMTQYPNMRIELGGHTDNVGDDNNNLTLSQERANAVKTALGEKGIDESRLVARGYGENQPVASNDTEDGRTTNRRTEFKIIAQ